MAHNIHKEKFLSHRKPAWHGLGLVVDKPLSAIEASRRIGIPRISTESIKTKTGLAIPDYKAIISKEKGSKKTVLSVVSHDYQEITHGDFVNLWHRATGGAPIETIGVLGKGEVLFITTKLPSFEVRGEELENYLLAYNPLSGVEAVTGRETPVRVVCQNTLMASAHNFRSQFRVIHVGAGASTEQIETWLKNLWETRDAQAKTLKEAYTLLSKAKLTDGQTKQVLSAVYPTPRKPERADPMTDAGLEALAKWERTIHYSRHHRKSVVGLYEGDGLGSTTLATQGTAWGLYNAVAEYENHKKKFRQPSSMVFGAGARRLQKTFDECLMLAK